MNIKYWLAGKLLSWALRYFANRTENHLTHGMADFVEETIDETKPTDFKLMDYIDSKLRKRGGKL